MAILASQSMVLKIQPVQFELDKKAKWVKTHFSFRITALGQDLIFEPSEDITVLYEDLVTLYKGVGQFIRMLQSLPGDSDPLDDSIQPYEFVPLELDFEISCLNGEVSDTGEGEVTMRVMVNLGIVDQTISSEYIGCTTNIEAKGLLDFLDQLEREIMLLP